MGRKGCLEHVWFSEGSSLFSLFTKYIPLQIQTLKLFPYFQTLLIPSSDKTILMG